MRPATAARRPAARLENQLISFLLHVAHRTTNQNEVPVHGGIFPGLAPSNGIPCFELIVISDTVEARHDGETDVGGMHDGRPTTLQIGLLETASLLVHHDAVRSIRG